MPSFEKERLHGRSNLNAWSDGWRVLFTLLREWAGMALPVDGKRLPRIRGWMPRAPRKPVLLMSTDTAPSEERVTVVPLPDRTTGRIGRTGEASDA